MTNVGAIEKATQRRVVNLFCDELVFALMDKRVPDDGQCEHR